MSNNTKLFNKNKNTKSASKSNVKETSKDKKKVSKFRRLRKAFFILEILFVAILAVYCYQAPEFTFRLESTLNCNDIELPEIVPFEGNLAPNDRLTKATYMAHKKAVGAETIVFTKEGTMYTGLANGYVVRVNEDGSLYKITQIGDVQNEEECSKNKTVFSNPKCGRPLGLRLKENSTFLYVADAFFGIIKINLANGEKTTVIGSNDPRFGTAPMKLTNDLDFDGDIIYFIDSSYERNVNEVIEEYLEALPKGRLFSFNEKTNKLEIIAENFYFPNGLQLGPQKDYALVNENSMSRIIKCHLKGSKKGQKEVFVNLPGFGDTIRLTEKNTLLAPIVIPRVSQYSSILDLLGKRPFLRNLLGNFLNLRYVALESKAVPRYGLIVEYDLNGKVLRSWHDPTGKIVIGSTNAVLHNDKLYIGSFCLDYIAVVDY